MRKIIQHTAFTLVGILLFSLHGCVKEFPNEPITTETPKTFLWLFPQSSINEGISKTRLHWWSEARNGYISGYLLAFSGGLSSVPTPDTITYTFTQKNDSTIQFPLYALRDTFLVVVRGIKGINLPLVQGAKVRLFPEPYWDKNGNHMFDSGDRLLPELKGSYDPIGASQKFPIRNSPPSVVFQMDVNGVTIHPPESTFTVASFSWIGSDPDGNQTIASYEIGLNDTASSNWMTISGSINFVTLLAPRSRTDNATSAVVAADVYSGTFPNLRLLGQIPGLKLNDTNHFYVRVKDIAGEMSQPKRLPESPKKWYVKKPVGRMLVISDYARPDSLPVQSFYRNVFRDVANGVLANYDELNIRRGATSTTSGVLVTSYLNPAFIETLRLFEVIYWYTDMFPSSSVAQFPLFLLSQAGGKVVYTTGFQDAVADPRGSLVDFAPLDSVFSGSLLGTPTTPRLGDNRIPRNYLVNPMLTGYPRLELDSLNMTGGAITNHLFFFRKLYKRADAQYIYRMQLDQQVPRRYLGEPEIAVIDDARRFVFFGLPIHILEGKTRGGQGVRALLNKIFVDEFGF